MWKIVRMDEKNCDPQKIWSQEIGVGNWWKKLLTEKIFNWKIDVNWCEI